MTDHWKKHFGSKPDYLSGIIGNATANGEGDSFVAGIVTASAKTKGEDDFSSTSRF